MNKKGGLTVEQIIGIIIVLVLLGGLLYAWVERGAKPLSSGTEQLQDTGFACRCVKIGSLNKCSDSKPSIADSLKDTPNYSGKDYSSVPVPSRCGLWQDCGEFRSCWELKVRS